MRKLNDYLFWFFSAIGTALFVAVLYPFFILKNLRFYLRAPSVFLYAVIFFLLDRVSKILILVYEKSLPLPVIKEFFTLQYVRNPGVAFGWFPDWRLPPIAMALVMITIITYYSFQLPIQERMTRWALALLVGGAIGNLYDRVLYGYVIDFLLFHFGKYDFPVFNVADVAIDLGVFLLFVDIFFLSPDESSENDSESVSAASAA